MQKPKTQIKKDNLVAQIKVLKMELSGVNTELTNKIKERDSLNIELLSAGKELEKTKQHSSDIKQVLLVRLEEFDNKEQALEKKSADIVEKELAFITKMKVDKKTFEDKIKLYSNTVLDLQGKIELRKQDVRVEQENLKYYQDLSKELKGEVKFFSQQKRQLETDIDKLNKKILLELVTLDKQLGRREQKLQKIEDEITIEKDKISQPVASLKETERKMDHKKRNLDVLIARFTKVFKGKYPNQELKL